MPRRQWSALRERQYEHIKDGLEQGRPQGVAEEFAARTVNKERARRGGLRRHRGSGGRTRTQFYSEVKRKHIKGRSPMSKAQLESAVGRS
jgi:hypothetical protein